MADAPPSLDYADARRRSRRRFWMIALVASALACGIVGRLLYQRLAPVIANRLEAVAAQRQVDALKPNGAAVEVAGVDPVTHPGYTISQGGGAAIQVAARRLLTARGVAPHATLFVVASRVQNALGQDRFLCVSIQAGGTYPVDATTLVVTVTGPVTLFSNASGPPVTDIVSLVPFRDRFRLDAPAIDANDSRRMLFTGLAGEVPFARELTIDASDRVHLREIPVMSPTPGPE